ncbi:C45 family autoproteolytic acyltransferase/hydolase [Amycolatopsis australiensis]|uniref:Acyl-coenzyme A:6-aminopenicillanic acid acyl-transferase n=1 Tax=Amycolatopsis australiensis TaxID=546364 RepID=A0A1K1P9S6_9PSEU|nr:C45 family peptidase [Amycolatopsis australiensis]SFW44528.1 Acyl-coenzyme A:6-aminopenicillanic acid acyl-transferase [Amycolatopsis australiensis]
MVATVAEHRIGDVCWTIVRGPREAAFRELGAYAAADIRTVLAGLPSWPVTARARRSPVLFRAIESASQVEHPDAYAELTALAEGAGVPFDDLLLANLRGDLGAGDGTGCTDLAWAGPRSLLGHNEDGDPVFDGIGRLLTLLIDGEPGVCVWWYPGFLPSNTFTITTHGLVWGIDSVSVVAPSPCAGRHFVARTLQRASTLAEAVSMLRSRTSAGGFAYTMGCVGSPGVTVAEKAGDETAVSTVANGLSWHTNHFRQLPPTLDVAPEESLARAEVCAHLTASDPDAKWLTAALTGDVHRDATGDDTLLTLSTVVTDLASGEVTVVPRGGAPLRAGAADLAAGNVGAVG